MAKILSHPIATASKEELEISDRLYTLALDQHDKWEETRTPADLDLAIQQLHEAIAAFADRSPHDEGWDEDWDLGARYWNLGDAYQDRYIQSSNSSDIRNAIQHLETALELTREDHPYRPNRQVVLAQAYHTKFERQRNIDDLDISIRIGQETMRSITDDDPRWINIAVTLAHSYHHRYQYRKAALDLETAVQLFEKIVDKIPEADPYRYDHLHNLALSYHDIYRRTTSVQDIDAAIRIYEKALRSAPTSEAEPQADLLSSLGIAYHNRWHETGKAEDLEAAMKKYEASLQMTDDSHPDLSDRTFWIAGLYQDKYETTCDINDLETAILLLKKALDLPHKYHTIDKLYRLGMAYNFRYERIGYFDAKKDELATAIKYFQEAVNHTSAPAHKRINPIRSLLALYMHTKQWSEAYEVVNSAMALFPILAPLSMDYSDKQELLAKWDRLASDGVAAALNAGKSPYDAIKLLELGRGVMIGPASDLPSDISNLQRQHPQEAEDYLKLRGQLDALGSLEGRFDERNHVECRLQEVTRRIRSQPGFEHFLLVPSEEDMRALAVLGPIVILNLTPYRSDALVIEEHQIKAIPLPDLKYNDVVHEISRKQPESLTSSNLESLWEAVAEPILDSLGFTQTPEGPWPRVWWIPTGLFTNLPIHAAGFHQDGTGLTVMDRVISSYSTSIKALIHSRRSAGSEEEHLLQKGRAVLVSVQELTHAPREVDELQRTLLHNGLQLSQLQPLWEEVINALGDCTIFHFAGHGKSDAANPLNSALILDDRPLTVVDLLGRQRQQDRRRPFLAYLSACGTGRIRNDELMDEGLHLITAFQLAGFQHVVGTLWNVNDELCVVVAKQTYEWVLRHGMSNESVSEGLHHAIRSLRGQWVVENAARSRNPRSMGYTLDDRMSIANRGASGIEARDVGSHEDTPLDWVPFVHFG
ncbi:TPR domain-containing protein [Xylaria curta]|nr:TPR domain-containing protein [Xylaria curta]